MHRVVGLRRWLLAAAGSLLAGVAAAAAPASMTLDAALAELARHPAVRAEFVQTRNNPALSKPQASRGKLLFVSAKGMLWQVEAPFAETLAFTPRGAAQVGPNGVRRALRNQRGMQEVTRMLQSLLAGEAGDVARQFHVTASGSRADWQLRFTPKQARVAKVLAAIELAGGEYLAAIRIRMQDGASTDITLDHAAPAATLTAFEQRALEGP